MIENWKRILYFGAHPDDEIIGAGGALARCSAQGAEITVVTFTLGDTSYTSPEAKAEMKVIRAREAAAVEPILGISRRILLNKPCQGVVNDRETYQECVRIIRQVRPDVILTHSYLDRHRDHRAVAEVTDEARYKAAENVLADLGEPWYTQFLYHYEVIELFPSPTLLIDITETMDKKLEAMATQKSQMAVLPGVMEYIKALGRVRGYQRGTLYAEALLQSSFFPSLG